jgi:hypothetical protein
VVCDKCGTKEGEVFTIHCGKKLSQASTSAQVSGNLNERLVTTITKYQIGQSVNEALCSSCIRRRRLAWLLTPLVLVVGLFPVMASYDGSNIPDWLLTPIGLVFLISLIVFLVVGLEGHHRFAEHMAFARRRLALKKAGWDTLWNDKDFARLQRQNALSRP